jgi:predicted phosphoribosyltransferase
VVDAARVLPAFVGLDLQPPPLPPVDEFRFLANACDPRLIERHPEVSEIARSLGYDPIAFDEADLRRRLSAAIVSIIPAMKYPDLRSGGVALAAALTQYRRAPNAIVLGIVRGGVTLATEVARSLGLPLDLVLLRSMMQRLPEPPLCAARVAGRQVLDDELQRIASNQPAIEALFIADALVALTERDRSCRGNRPERELAGRTVLLVDNGMRTGGTMRNAIRMVRALAPARIVYAVPTGSAEAVSMVTPFADEAICLSSPEPYPHVGMFYQRFDVGDEREILAMLDDFETADNPA